jgi:enoyl-[acyl-carrier protein] reductase I
MDTLEGKRILVTGLATPNSIAFAVATRAQKSGAQVVLAAFPRDLEGARAAAQQLPAPVEVHPVDATDQDDLDRLCALVEESLGGLDGALHAIAFASQKALARLVGAPYEAVSLAFHTSTYSYAALGGVLARLAPPHGAALVGLDFDGSRAWPMYNWMGVCKAGLEAVNKYLARELAPRRIRANLVAAGPLRTRAALAIPDFDRVLRAWEAQAPLPWDPGDPTPVADAACFLLSDAARAITGEVLHVDGGYHAMAAPVAEPGPGRAAGS